ncbi:hypothetical protein J2Z75_003950 [Rhizobium herbae]|uniref:Uncharacterized protein n=1 Tax=Rhizobium herbae TaxID=508661 RepID=A0ABS4ER50_9HYPH|nr:hypothetical protein [Rhizobium herbae]
MHEPTTYGAIGDFEPGFAAMDREEVINQTFFR